MSSKGKLIVDGTKIGNALINTAKQSNVLSNISIIGT